MKRWFAYPFFWVRQRDESAVDGIRLMLLV
jgi:hypothetical protein